jgi:hypothetical protein
MRTTYDLKSSLIGVLITALVVLALGAIKDESYQVGRFRVETNRNHVFILDTMTDQVWEKYVRVSEGTTSENFAEPKLRAYKE